MDIVGVEEIDQNNPIGMERSRARIIFAPLTLCTLPPRRSVITSFVEYGLRDIYLYDRHPNEAKL